MQPAPGFRDSHNNGWARSGKSYASEAAEAAVEAGAEATAAVSDGAARTIWHGQASFLFSPNKMISNRTTGHCWQAFGFAASECTTYPSRDSPYKRAGMLYSVHTTGVQWSHEDALRAGPQLYSISFPLPPCTCLFPQPPRPPLRPRQHVYVMPRHRRRHYRCHMNMEKKKVAKARAASHGRAVVVVYPT